MQTQHSIHRRQSCPWHFAVNRNCGGCIVFLFHLRYPLLLTDIILNESCTKVENEFVPDGGFPRFWQYDNLREIKVKEDKPLLIP